MCTKIAHFRIFFFGNRPLCNGNESKLYFFFSGFDFLTKISINFREFHFFFRVHDFENKHNKT